MNENKNLATCGPRLKRLQRLRKTRAMFVAALAVVLPATAAMALSDNTQSLAHGSSTASVGFEKESNDAPMDDLDEDLAGQFTALGDSLEDTIDDLAQDLELGEASWYGTRFAGQRTASGERFDPAQLTAAHRTLPFGSRVRVTSERSGDSVVVRINDRGPFNHARVIDLSEAAAKAIGIRGHGRGQVRLALVTG